MWRATSSKASKGMAPPTLRGRLVELGAESLYFSRKSPSEGSDRVWGVKVNAVVGSLFVWPLMQTLGRNPFVLGEIHFLGHIAAVFAELHFAAAQLRLWL